MDTRAQALHACRSAREPVWFRRLGILATVVGLVAAIGTASPALAGWPQDIKCQGGFPPGYDDTEKHQRFLDNQDRMARERRQRSTAETVWPWFCAASSVVVILMWILKRKRTAQPHRDEQAEPLDDADQRTDIPPGEVQQEDQTAGVRTKGPSFRLNLTSVEPLPGNEGLCVLRGRLKAGEPRPGDRLLPAAAGVAGTATVVKVSSEPAGSAPGGTQTCLLVRGLEPGTAKVGDVVLGEPRVIPAAAFPMARLVSAPPQATEVLALKCPHCGKALKVKAGAVGKAVKCPACKQPFQVER
jgi:hypothetical protein